jgi:hypothetical protein
MKASELIKELQERIEMYGDLEVVLWDAVEGEDRTRIVQVTADIANCEDCECFIEIEFE